MSDPRIAIRFEAITGDFFTAINAVQNSVNSLSKTLGGVSGNFRSFGSEIAQSQSQAANAVKYAQGTILDQFGNVIPVIKQEGQAAQVTGDKLVQLGTKAEATAQKTGRLRTGVNNTSLAFVSFGRVLQDTPYGFNAIANNLTELPAAFAQVSAAAKSTGKSITSVVLSSLTGPAGIAIALSSVVAALQFASLGFDNWTRGFGSGKKAVDEYREKIDDLKKSLKGIGNIRIESVSNSAGDIAQVKSLSEAIKSNTTSLQEKKRAIEILKSISGDYFGDIQAEASYYGILTQRVNEYTKSIIAKSYVNLLSDEIAKATLLKNTLEDRYNSEEENIKQLQKNYESVTEAAKKANVTFQPGQLTSSTIIDTKTAENQLDNAKTARTRALNELVGAKKELYRLNSELDRATNEGLKNLIPKVDFNIDTNDAKKSVDNAGQSIENSFEKLRQRLRDSLEDATRLEVKIPEKLIPIPLNFEIPTDKKAQGKLRLAVNEQIKDITDYTKNEVDLRKVNATLDVELVSIQIAKERDKISYLKSINREYTQEYRDHQNKLAQLLKKRIEEDEQREIEALNKSGERNNTLYNSTLEKIKAKFKDQRLNVDAELNFKPTFLDLYRYLTGTFDKPVDVNIGFALSSVKLPLDFIEKIKSSVGSISIPDIDLPEGFKSFTENLLQSVDPQKIKEWTSELASTFDLTKLTLNDFISFIENKAIAENNVATFFKEFGIETVSAIKESTDKITGEITTTVESYQDIGKLVEFALENFAEAFGSTLGEGGSLGQAIARGGEAILKIIGDVLINLGKKVAVVGKIKIFLDKVLKGIMSPAGGPLAIVAGLALVALGAALKSVKLYQEKAVTAFAEGGIVTGPTLALIGEAGKEAVIPLSKFDQVVGSRGATDVFVTGLLSGETIYLQQQRAINRRDRFV